MMENNNFCFKKSKNQISLRVNMKERFREGKCQSDIRRRTAPPRSGDTSVTLRVRCSVKYEIVSKLNSNQPRPERDGYLATPTMIKHFNNPSEVLIKSLVIMQFITRACRGRLSHVYRPDVTWNFLRV